MAVKTVTAAINGVSVNLSLDESTGKYVGTLTAPSATSWGQEENKYGITVTAEDTAEIRHQRTGMTVHLVQSW